MDPGTLLGSSKSRTLSINKPPPAVNSLNGTGTATVVPSTAPVNLLRGWPHPSMLSAELLKQASTTVFSSPRHATDALSYGPDNGNKALLYRLALWLTTFYKVKPPINSDRLCISGGASQNLACVLQAYTDPVFTRKVWMISPTYFLASRIFADAGFGPGRVSAVPEDDEGIDIAALIKGLEASEKEDAGKTFEPIKSPQPWNKRFQHVIYCVPTFANPSGKTVTLRRREALVRVARKYNALIICDDVYDMLGWTVSNAERGAPLLKLAEETPIPRLVDVDRTLDGGPTSTFGNVLSQGTFSKLLGPGTRTGWAEGAPAMAYGLSQVGSSRSGGAPSQLAAALIADGLRTGDVQRHVMHVVRPALAKRWVRLNLSIRTELSPLGVKRFHTASGKGVTEEGEIQEEVDPLQGGYFISVQLPAGISAVKLAERCRARTGLILGPGPLFAVDTANETEKRDLRGMVRLCFAWEDEDRLEQGVKEVAEDLKRLLHEREVISLDGTVEDEMDELDLAKWR